MRILFLIVKLLLMGCHLFAQSGEEFYEKALQKEKQNDLPYASLLIDKAIGMEPGNIWYVLKKAEIHIGLKQYQEAVASISAAIAIDTTFSESYNFAGRFFSSGGFFQEAIEMYDQAIHYAKNDTLRHSYIMNRGTAKSVYMDYENALKDFEQVLAFNPESIGCLNNTAQTYVKLNQPQKAIETFKKVISLDGSFIGPYINLGLLYTELDSLDLAIEYFNQALEISSEEALLFSNRGFAYYKLGDYRLALRDVNKSLSMYPSNSFAYKNLALIYFALGKNEEACSALDYAEYYGYAKFYGQEVNELKSSKCTK
jgi:tetratricopeptide (TPR) repeat protein